MLVIFFKALIVFLVVLFCVRLMGKRQLGEMQPFELVIMLIVADVACIPINDPYVPFYGGLVPIITLTFLHVVFSFVARKSLFARRLLSGRAVIVIDKNGINYRNLQKMNLNMHDLLEAVHAAGYMDVNQIAYAIFETNGKMCVVEKPQPPDKPEPALLPLSLLVDGKWEEKNLQKAGVSAAKALSLLKANGIKKAADVLYMDVRQDGTVYVSPKTSCCFIGSLSVKGAW